MKPLTWILAVLLTLPMLLWAQAPDTLWMQPYPNLTRAVVLDIVQTSDGGFGGVAERMIMPDTFSSYTVMMVIKTDAEGNLTSRWETAGSLDTMASGRAICTDVDGGFTVLGHNAFESVHRNFVVARFDPDGNLAWQRQYDAAPFDWASSIRASEDGGFVISGHTASGELNAATLLKISGAGDSLWTQYYPGSTDHSAEYLVNAPDGGYVFAGRSYETAGAPSTSNFLLTKVGPDGTVIWEQTYGSEGYWEYPFCLAAAPDGGYVTATLWDMELSLVRFDESGEIVWVQPVTGFGDCMLNIRDVEADSDGGFVFAGYCATPEQPSVLFKTDSEGNMVWQVIRGRGNRDGAIGLCGVSDGGYMTCGNTDAGLSGGWGSPCLTRWNFAPNASERPLASSPSAFALAQNYPNPFNPTTEITFDIERAGQTTLAVYDVLGQQVALLADGILPAGRHVRTFDGASLCSGVYFCRLEGAGLSQTRKMMLLK